MAFKAPCVRTQNRDSPLELLCTHMGAPTLPSGAVINVCPQMKLNSQLFFLFRPQPLIWFLMACQTPTCLSTCRSPSGQSLLMASSSTTVWQKKPGISCRSHSLEGCQSSGKLYINHSRTGELNPKFHKMPRISSSTTPYMPYVSQRPPYFSKKYGVKMAWNQKSFFSRADHSAPL